MSNLLKSSWVVFHEQDARIINSNERLDKQLSELHGNDENSEEMEYNPEDQDGFSDGLEAEQVDALLCDDGAEGILNDNSSEEGGITPIIKAEPVEMGPTAEELLEDAKRQAEEILEQARNEAEEIKKNAYAAGHQEGYDAGIADLQQQAAMQEQQYSEMEQQLQLRYKEKQEELEPMFVDLITNIYEHIFHIDLSDFRDIIIYSIIHVIGTTDGKKDFIVRVSSADYEYVNERKPQIMESVSENATLELVEDVTMAQGECMIETGGGIFDCGIDTQLEGLNKELKLLSYEKE